MTSEVGAEEAGGKGKRALGGRKEEVNLVGQPRLAELQKVVEFDENLHQSKGK